MSGPGIPEETVVTSAGPGHGTFQAFGFDVHVDPAREDWADSITLISPYESPFFSSLPKVSSNSLVHEWVTDALKPAMFREPKFVQMAAIGDVHRYLWVMEPVRGRIFGCGFEISRTQVCALSSAEYADYFNKQKTRAYVQMLLRSEHDEFLVPEGSRWEAFV